MFKYLIIAAIVLAILVLLPKKRTKTSLRVFFFINNQFKPLKFMKLNVQQFVNAKLGLIDSDTKEVIETQFENIQLSSSDEAVFTVSTDVNADGELDLVGIAPGTADLKVEAVAKYTDKNTNQPVVAGKDATVSITVSQPEPGAENTELVVSFTDAADVPTQGPGNPDNTGA